MARRRTRRRFELGWFEAVVLLIGYVASLGIVGMAGLYVGQRAARQHFGKEERLLRLPISAAGSGAKGAFAAGEPAITFYDKLGKADERRGEGRIIMPPGQQEKSEIPEKPAGTQVSSGRAVREQGPKKPAAAGGSSTPPSQGTQKPAAVDAAATANVLARRAPAPSQQRPGLLVNTRGGGSVASGTPDLPPGVTPEAAATARAVAEPEPMAAPAPPSPAVWSVQVNATRDAATAEELVRRLRERGYDAFIVEQSRDGVVWYRVRVGRLPSIEMANALVGRIKEREGLSQAYVASD